MSDAINSVLSGNLQRRPYVNKPSRTTKAH
jgi:hypothetical protein